MFSDPFNPDTHGRETRVFRIMSYPVCNRRHTVYRLWDIVRTDLGTTGRSPLCREKIEMDLSINVLDVSETWEGNTLVRLSCPNHIPNLAVVGSTPNVLSATCGNGVLAVTVRLGHDPYFTVDFEAAVTQPFDAVLKGSIQTIPEDFLRDKERQMEDLGAGLVHPRCSIDFSAITADIATGSSS